MYDFAYLSSWAYISTGVVKDATSSYTYTLWMLGGCEFAAFCLWLLMPCAEKFDENKCSKKPKETENLKLSILNC
ncbi:hypothetical protein Avbf_15737 [Armadillidium vulgare]|nr:hypothetical protein Avbf_15737 [Armadillidium vulgare]